MSSHINKVRIYSVTVQMGHVGLYTTILCYGGVPLELGMSFSKIEHCMNTSLAITDTNLSSKPYTSTSLDRRSSLSHAKYTD